MARLDADDMIPLVRDASGGETSETLTDTRILRFLKSRLGDELAGSIVNITSAGLVIELENLFVTGMILYQDLGGDYFVRDSDISLKGRATGKSFHMGQKMQVILASVAPLQLRLTLVPAETNP